jgi:hypothetical protein
MVSPALQVKRWLATRARIPGEAPRCPTLLESQGPADAARVRTGGGVEPLTTTRLPF